MNEDQDKVHSNTKKSDKKFFIFYIMFCIIITSIAIIMTIQYLHSKSNNSINNNSAFDTKKIKAEDEKFALTSYSETYNANDLVINEYRDYNGTIIEVTNEDNMPDGNYISYIQIDGLKDKTIQGGINQKFKDTAYNMSNQGIKAKSHIWSSFSNVISVSIETSDDIGISERKCFNIDLSTGEEIPFEKIFVSSAPINAILSEGAYKTLSWDYRDKNTNEDNWDDDFDMSKHDISDFEEKVLTIARRYEKNKGNIQYILRYDNVWVYGLLDGLTQNDWDSFEIDFVDHMEDIAIYKRYLKEESIFERNDLGMKNIIVCEYPIPYSPNGPFKAVPLTYGMVSDNLFIEEFFETYGEVDPAAQNNIISYIKNNSSKNISLNANEGAFYQILLDLSESDDGKSYYLHSNTTIATCEINYFKRSGFKYYIKAKTRDTADASTTFFYKDEVYNEFPGFNVEHNYSDDILVFDKNGKYIKTISEAERIASLFDDNDEIEEDVLTSEVEESNIDDDSDEVDDTNENEIQEIDNVINNVSTNEISNEIDNTIDISNNVESN